MKRGGAVFREIERNKREGRERINIPNINIGSAKVCKVRSAENIRQLYSFWGGRNLVDAARPSIERPFR